MQPGIVAGNHCQLAGGIDCHIGVGAGEVKLSLDRRRGEFGHVDDGKTVVAGGHIGGQLGRVLRRAGDGHRLRGALQRRRSDDAGRQREAGQRIEALLDRGEVVDAVLVGVLAGLAGADGEFDVVGETVKVGVGRSGGIEYHAGREVGSLARGTRYTVAVTYQSGDRIEGNKVIARTRREEEVEMAAYVAYSVIHRPIEVCRLNREEIVSPVRVEHTSQSGPDQGGFQDGVIGIVRDDIDLCIQQAKLFRMELRAE